VGIDPILYEKYSGRTGDPHSRLGEALARSEKGKARREGMPKGVSGGLRVSMLPGEWANIFFFWKWFRHSRMKD
jgi:hypothetical protein